MTLKSFDEFLATEFSDKSAVKVAADALASMGDDTKNLPLEQKLALLSGIQANSVLTKDILRRYHNWLSNQL